jgi:hypothetical protein
MFANSPSSGACVNPPMTSGSCMLYNLTFTVIGSPNATTELSFTDPVTNTTEFQFDNGTPSADTNDGRFMVFGPTAATVAVSGKVNEYFGQRHLEFHYYID